MKEELVKIKWTSAIPASIIKQFWERYDDSCEYLLDLENKNHTLLDNDGEYMIPKKPVIISFYGLTSFFKEYCSEVGEELICNMNNIVKNYIIDYINNELNSKIDSEEELLETIKSKQPGNGEFFLVFKIQSKDIVEDDIDIKCVGVLGKDVKLVY